MRIDFRDRLFALLPPLRDDEPASLRQDILEELADHLTCTYHREILRGTDESVARQRVLERFGDPAAVARRLWLDAMKSKIMAQRVLIATCFVLMLSFATFTSLAWHWRNQDLIRQEAAAAANQRMEAVLTQAQITTQDMVKQMHEVSEALRHPRSPDWNPVSFKFTEETLDGPPVAKVSVHLNRVSDPWKIHRITDASGIADFGSVQPGDYSSTIDEHPATINQSTHGQLNIQPASTTLKSIVCPKSPPVRANVRVKLAWPTDLEKEPLVIYAPFVFSHRTLEPGLEWTARENFGPERPNNLLLPVSAWRGFARQRDPVRSALMGPGKTITDILNFKAPILWTKFKGDNLAAAADAAAKLEPGDWAEMLVEDLREVTDVDGLKWEPGIYGLNELIVLRPNQSASVEAGRKRFDILVAASPHDNLNLPILLSSAAPEKDHLELICPELVGPPIYRPNRRDRYPVGFHESLRTVGLPQAYWIKLNKGFEARLGETNEWTIPLPDELIQAVREALKVDTSPKKSQ